MQMSGKTYKVAILGHGFAGALHREVIEEGIEGLKVTAIAEPDSEKTRGLGYKHFPSYKDLIKSYSPEAVIVALPTELHREAVFDIAEKRIPMLLEKPLGTNYYDAYE